MRGVANPTVAEQVLFQTKTVLIPTRTHEAEAMLKATSLVLDVVQGAQHPHAVAYRQFCKQHWAPIADLVNHSLDPSLGTLILPKVLRAVQLRMAYYF